MCAYVSLTPPQMGVVGATRSRTRGSVRGSPCASTRTARDQFKEKIRSGNIIGKAPPPKKRHLSKEKSYQIRKK